MNKKTIWKYRLKVTDEQLLEMPIGAEILTVQVQDGEPCLWALVDPDAVRENRKIYIFGTGNPLLNSISILKYISTFQQLSGKLVWHVFAKN